MVVVPSPTSLSVLMALSLIMDKIVLIISSSLFVLEAIVTPSLVINGALSLLLIITLLPLGPRVVLTASDKIVIDFSI